MKADSSDKTFSRALKLTGGLAGLIAIVGSLIGFLSSGLAGVLAALIGAGVATIFGLMTILSVWIGGKLPLNGFYAVVLGGWLIKFLVFAAVLLGLQGEEAFDGPVFFFAVVATVLGGLAIDSWLVLKGRTPTVGE
ncbi:hypothetical protein N9453_02675 [Aquiluna sp.]|nr:hypothetical protein [Aquiluna sp.]MDA7761063.1 hypothetical protein [Aquiluna sp.]MDA8927401.1 hypothetical protein [Aquiluna sp.]MDA9010582.1 hypothetical protein [Aquiluna sp.]MDB4018743.1 hypothetical protein [Aquiluna sp.]